jgi:hypothetical protein
MTLTGQQLEQKRQHIDAPKTSAGEKQLSQGNSQI